MYCGFLVRKGADIGLEEDGTCIAYSIRCFGGGRDANRLPRPKTMMNWLLLKMFLKG